MFYQPPLWLRSGTSMTIYAAIGASRNWQKNSPPLSSLPFQSHIFQGANKTPMFGWWAKSTGAKGTIVATYGITGSLEDQWFLHVLAHKAYSAGYGLLLFDWRAHGKTAELSPNLTSDGLYEGQDFVLLADQGKQLGLTAPFFFSGYSLGGQLALWGLKASEEMDFDGLTLESDEIASGAVICPSLESHRSLTYLEKHPLYKYFEKAIAANLQKLAWKLLEYHPDSFKSEIIEKAKTIREFDKYLVIPHLGFLTTKDYYAASSPLYFLGDLQKPTFILYAADDPLFEPELLQDLQWVAEKNSKITAHITDHGGHVGYISDKKCQEHWGDTDPWWAWQRIMDWFETQNAQWQTAKNYAETAS